MIISDMDWETEARPLLEAVARAIDANGGENVSAEMVGAQLDYPLDEEQLDRKLGELLKGGFIEGPTVNQRAGPVFISLAPRSREIISGWPGQSAGGVSIVGSTIGNVAGRDVNINVTVPGFFDAWEQKIEELDAPPEEKKKAREGVRMAKDAVTSAAGSAGGRLIYDAFPLLFG